MPLARSADGGSRGIHWRGCGGALPVNNGREAEATAFARRTIDTFEAAGVEHRTRGATLSEQLALLRTEHPDLELLVGGASGPAFARMARYADGYAHGGGPPRAFASAATKAKAAWSDLGRPGRPKLWGQAYFALGDPERGTDYLLDYYGSMGTDIAEMIAGSALRSPDAVAGAVPFLVTETMGPA